MGAPGEAFLCKRGHLYQWVDDDLYWDEDLDRESSDPRETGCPCGEKSVVVLCHYGDLNDCRPPGKQILRLGRETVRWRERIPDAVDRDGNPLSVAAYRNVELALDVYDVSTLEFPVPVRES